MKKFNFKLASLACAISSVCSVNVNAQTDERIVEEFALEEVTVLGSRRIAPRSAMDAAVPVDVIGAEEFSRQGDTDPIAVLTAIIPSFNANREPISDAATLVRPVNLRGLPSDHTLVLVNGKRRHRGAVVGEFVSGINRGAQGVDVSPLFGAAIKQVEVLRDGAAAQYGSDAIAGVMNFALQDDPEIRKLTMQYGEAYEGDGQKVEISGAFGTTLGRDDSFAVFAFQVKESDPTSRGVQDGEGTNSGATALQAAGFPVENPVVHWGAPEVTNDYKLIINAAIPINESVELYSFGNYATRDVDGSFFYRNPAGRTGVFVDGDSNVLFADTTGDGGCPSGALPTASFSESQAFIGSAPANCFAFQSIFPGGFTPRFGGNVTDQSFAVGLRGEFANQMTFDISVMTGENNVGYEMTNSVNASMGPDSPFEFDLGGQIQSETVINADFAKGVEVSAFASELNVAFGLQYQDEEFEIEAGQLESYLAGPYVSQGFSVGSNGFQGFSADTAGIFDRTSSSAYLDLEADITESLLITAAIRYEDFSDFGTTTNGKLAGRFRINENFAIRGAVSTGFRAPTLGQSNLQRASTGFVGGQLTEQLVIASTDPIAEFFGGGQLSAEEAENFSIGFTGTIGELEITVDYFDIDVEDRVAITSTSISDADRATLVNMGIAEAATVTQVQFFVNDFNTNTSGFDVVANYPLEWENSTTELTLALNYTDTEVTKQGTTVSDGRKRELEDSIPSYRATFSAVHRFGPFTGLLRVNYYDEAYESLFNDASLPVVTDAMVLVDAEIDWEINDNISIAVGAKNLFDQYPDEWETAGFSGRDGGFLGAIYPLNHPAGLGGGSYYLRVKAEF